MTSFTLPLADQPDEMPLRWDEAIRYEPTEDGWAELAELSEIEDHGVILSVAA